MDLASAYVLHRLISSGPVFQSSTGGNHSRENGGLVLSVDITQGEMSRKGG